MPLVEGADRLDHVPALEDLAAALLQERDEAAVEAGHREAAVPVRGLREGADLIGGDRRGLLDEHMQPLIQAMQHDVEEMMRGHKHPDRVGRDLLQHLLVLGAAVFDLELVGGSVALILDQVAQADHLDVFHLGERGVVHTIGHAPGAD